MKKPVGVLALQGDFALHQQAIHRLGRVCKEVRTVEELSEVEGLILPGGESTALLKLLKEDLREELRARSAAGMPLLATCAGLILVADRVEQPAQESLELLDVTVIRNAYGRQLDSFIDRNIPLTAHGQSLLATKTQADRTEIEGVFIRAPRIRWTGKNVEVLAEKDGEPVLVRQGAVLAACFHPELGEERSPIHELFLSFVDEPCGR